MGGHFQQGVERYWNLGGKMKKKYNGRVPKNKMEIFNGIFHEGGGVSSSLKFFSLFCFKNI